MAHSKTYEEGEQRIGEHMSSYSTIYLFGRHRGPSSEHGLRKCHVEIGACVKPETTPSRNKREESMQMSHCTLLDGKEDTTSKRGTLLVSFLSLRFPRVRLDSLLLGVLFCRFLRILILLLCAFFHLCSADYRFVIHEGMQSDHCS